MRGECPGGYASEPMVECISPLKEKSCPELVYPELVEEVEVASQTLKAQITVYGPYRCRLEGIVRASLHTYKTDRAMPSAE